MAEAIGYKSKAAFRLHGASATGYPLSTDNAEAVATVLRKGDLIPLLSESISEEYEYALENTIIGHSGVARVQNIARMGGGGLSCEGCYLGLDSLIAAALGWEKPANSAANSVSPLFTESAGGEGSAVSGTTATGTTGTTIVATTEVFSSNMVGEWVRIEETGDTSEGQVRRITAIASATTATITPEWTTNPGAGKAFTAARIFTHLLEPAPSLHDELITNYYTNYHIHTSGLSTHLLKRWGTLVAAKTVSNWEWRAAMVESMKISFKPKDGLLLDFEIVPFDLDRVNSQTPGYWAWSAGKYHQERVRFADCVFRLGNYSASTPLNDDNILSFQEFELTVKNNMQLDARGTSSGLYRLQPMINSRREISGSLTLPRYAADARLASHSADTILMADLVCTGSTPISTTPVAFKLYLNSLKLLKPDITIPGPGVLTEKWGFEVILPAATPSGMNASTNGYLEQLTINTVNTNPYNAFRGQNAETA